MDQGRGEALDEGGLAVDGFDSRSYGMIPFAADDDRSGVSGPGAAIDSVLGGCDGHAVAVGRYGRGYIAGVPAGPAEGAGQADGDGRR